MSSDTQNRHSGSAGGARRSGQVDPVTKNFKGIEPDIDAVIGLRHEVIDRKKDYEKFVEIIATYVSTKVKLGTYLSPMITDGVDPIAMYEKEETDI